MPFTVRKVRNADKYTLKIKDDNGTVTLTQIFDSRDEAMNRARTEEHKEVNKPISVDTIADDTFEDTLALSGETDTEIDDV
jgi:transposase-like protein